MLKLDPPAIAQPELLSSQAPGARGPAGKRRSLDPPPWSLMRIDEVLRHYPVSRAQLYELIAEGHFPKPIRIGRRSVAWTSISFLISPQAQPHE